MDNGEVRLIKTEEMCENNSKTDRWCWCWIKIQPCVKYFWGIYCIAFESFSVSLYFIIHHQKQPISIFKLHQSCYVQIHFIHFSLSHQQQQQQWPTTMTSNDGCNGNNRDKIAQNTKRKEGWTIAREVTEDKVCIVPFFWLDSLLVTSQCTIKWTPPCSPHLSPTDHLCQWCTKPSPTGSVPNLG